MDTMMAMDDYRMFVVLHRAPWCWYCGRGPHGVPCGWYGPWLIERAHLVSKPRREDSRAVVALCSLCHRLSHGLAVAAEGGELTPPTLANMLWLKRRFDAARYDREFLGECIIGRLPRAAVPAADVQAVYRGRRREYPGG